MGRRRLPLSTCVCVYHPGNPSCTGCTASLNAKRASLTNLFFIPPLSFFITGLWTFTRRPPTYAAPFLYKCVWNEMKNRPKNRFVILLCFDISLYLYVFSHGQNLQGNFERKRKRVRDSKGRRRGEKSTIIVSDTDELRSNGQKSYYFYLGVFFWWQQSFENFEGYINVYEMYLLK